MDVAIVGGGIVGLALALNLHKRGISCRVFEAVPDVKELGVGITLLPHAFRELSALGLEDELRAAGIENRESAFYNRFGQLIYKEPRGKFAGLPFSEIGIHRGRLHSVLYEAAKARLGTDKIVLGRRCVAVEQDDNGVTLRFVDTATGANAPSIQATVAIACDGVNSAARRQFYPDEQLVFTGINTWRGVTRGKPILDGRTYFRIGSIKTGKIVIYPIADDIDGEGKQLINWTTEIQTNTDARNDWNKPGRLEDFYAIYESWTFDWLNVAELIRNSESIFEYPMVDKDPIARWTFGRVTLAGDAAHPMYPRGSNGSAQGLIDARTLADSLQHNADPLAALTLYEQARTDATARVVRANRENPPDFINIKVEELTGDRPFENLDDFISQADLRRLSEQYKAVAGFDLARLSGGNPAAKAGS
jgi:2-polyprenyl-6-methoxyphenol hydroxylase-like FAD-dependent oxidoreductase